MKLRIQDNSFRFRISIRELEQLAESGRIQCESRFEGDDAGCFHYGIEVVEGSGESGFRIDLSTLTLLLSRSHLEQLKSPDREGIYLRRRWIDGTGLARRGMAFVEKDRPASRCDKPETWIYDHSSPGGAGKSSH